MLDKLFQYLKDSRNFVLAHTLTAGVVLLLSWPLIAGLPAIYASVYVAGLSLFIREWCQLGKDLPGSRFSLSKHKAILGHLIKLDKLKEWLLPAFILLFVVLLISWIFGLFRHLLGL
jgi:hypothetical protein